MGGDHRRGVSMATYETKITLTFTESVEATSKEEAVNQIMDNFYNDYGLRISQEEIQTFKVEVSE